MSNNPFIDHSASAYERYPDISQTGSPASFSGTPSWQQPQGYPQQQQYGQGGYGGSGFQQPQQTGWGGMGGGGGGYGMGGGMQSPMNAPRSGFTPSSMFGQQMAAQLGGGGGGGMGTPQSPYAGGMGMGGMGGGMGYQQTGYPGQQQAQWGQPQQQQTDWNVIAQFDPYSNLGALDNQTGSGAGLFGGTGPSSSSAPPMSSYPSSGSMSYQGQGGGSSAAPAGHLHPRELVQRYKRELEAWDPYAWKQLTNSFDTLKSSWDTRGREIQDRIRGLGNMPSYDYGAAQENQRLNELAKQAKDNHDNIAAAAFQTVEVHSSYRTSGDASSKRRVREALNASLNALPDWPPMQW